jgi:protein-tyrosine phosphatase
VIDLHSHILPGVDDGAPTAEVALEMARAAVADGIEVLAATPHVRGDYRTSPERMERLVEAMRDVFRDAAVPLDLRTGGEIGLDVLPELSDDELRRFGLGGNPGTLLIEFPYSGWPVRLEEAVFQLRIRGFQTVLAHPERNAEVQERPDRLAAAVEGGALVQLTASSLDGRLGRRARAAALRLLVLELAHLVASDAHAPWTRDVGMTGAAEAVGDPLLARWLTHDVPSSILDGVVPVERPSASRRRRSWLRRRF